MDPVSSSGIPWVVTFDLTFALGVAGVVADEPRASDDEVQHKAQHLHADGDQEEDQGVLLLIRDQQLGEDARQRDDHSGRA